MSAHARKNPIAHAPRTHETRRHESCGGSAQAALTAVRRSDRDERRGEQPRNLIGIVAETSASRKRTKCARSSRAAPRTSPPEADNRSSVREREGTRPAPTYTHDARVEPNPCDVCARDSSVTMGCSTVPLGWRRPGDHEAREGKRDRDDRSGQPTCARGNVSRRRRTRSPTSTPGTSPPMWPALSICQLENPRIAIHTAHPR